MCGKGELLELRACTAKRLPFHAHLLNAGIIYCARAAPARTRIRLASLASPASSASFRPWVYQSAARFKFPLDYGDEEIERSESLSTYLAWNTAS